MRSVAHRQITAVKKELSRELAIIIQEELNALLFGIQKKVRRLNRQRLRKFDEGEHPRDKGGEFTSKGGGDKRYASGDDVRIERSPTDWLIKNQITKANLPLGHIDRFNGIKFEEGTWAHAWAKGGKIIDAAGFYDTREMTITLSSNKDNIHIIGGATVLHEIGHHVHITKMTDKGCEEWASISNNGKAARISAYAGTNQGEHFAECYRAYALGDKKRAALRVIEPKAYNFMVKLFTGRGGYLLPENITADYSTFYNRYNPDER